VSVLPRFYLFVGLTLFCVNLCGSVLPFFNSLLSTDTSIPVQKKNQKSAKCRPQSQMPCAIVNGVTGVNGD
jgi:hypothetical protein